MLREVDPEDMPSLESGGGRRLRFTEGKELRGQRQYDQETVNDITDMAKAMMDAGLCSSAKGS